MNRNFKSHIERIVGETLARLVLHPSDLELSVVEKPFLRTRKFQVTVRPHVADAGRLIGTGGTIFKALRICIEAVGEREGEFVTFERLLDPIVGRPDRYQFNANSNWPAGQDDFKAWFTELITAVFDGDVSIECKDSEQQPDTYETQVHCSIQSASNLTALKANRIIEAVSVLVESVGRSYGRFMTLHGFEEPRVAQPAAADGRFAKAKER